MAEQFDYIINLEAKLDTKSFTKEFGDARKGMHTAATGTINDIDRMATGVTNKISEAVRKIHALTNISVTITKFDTSALDRKALNRKLGQILKAPYPLKVEIKATGLNQDQVKALRSIATHMKDLKAEVKELNMSFGMKALKTYMNDLERIPALWITAMEAQNRYFQMANSKAAKAPMPKGYQEVMDRAANVMVDRTAASLSKIMDAQAKKETERAATRRTKVSSEPAGTPKPSGGSGGAAAPKPTKTIAVPDLGSWDPKAREYTGVRRGRVETPAAAIRSGPVKDLFTELESALREKPTLKSAGSKEMFETQTKNYNEQIVPRIKQLSIAIEEVVKRLGLTARFSADDKVVSSPTAMMKQLREVAHEMSGRAAHQIDQEPKDATAKDIQVLNALRAVAQRIDAALPAKSRKNVPNMVDDIDKWAPEGAAKSIAAGMSKASQGMQETSGAAQKLYAVLDRLALQFRDLGIAGEANLTKFFGRGEPKGYMDRFTVNPRASESGSYGSGRVDIGLLQDDGSRMGTQRAVSMLYHELMHQAQAAKGLGGLDTPGIATSEKLRTTMLAELGADVGATALLAQDFRKKNSKLTPQQAILRASDISQPYYMSGLSGGEPMASGARLASDYGALKAAGVDLMKFDMTKQGSAAKLTEVLGKLAPKLNLFGASVDNVEELFRRLAAAYPSAGLSQGNISGRISRAGGVGAFLKGVPVGSGTTGRSLSPAANLVGGGGGAGGDYPVTPTNMDGGGYSPLRGAFRRLGSYAVAGSLIYGGMQVFYQLGQQIMAISKQSSELNRILQLNVEKLGAVKTELIGVAVQYGQTTEEVFKASQEWAKQGIRGSQLTSLTGKTAEFTNVSEMLPEDAVKSLTAATKQYGKSLTEVGTFTDKWIKLSQSQRVDAADLAKGFAEASSTAKEAGVSIDQLNALIASTAAVANDSGEQVGNAMKIIFARLLVPKTTTIAPFARIGMDLEKTMKSGGVPAVLDELAQKWDNLSAKERESIAIAMGEKRRAQIVLSLMTAYKDTNGYQKAFNDSTNAQGAAAKANAERMKALDKIVQSLKTSFGEFAAQFADGPLLQGIQDFMKLMTNLVHQFNTMDPMMRQIGNFAVGAGMLLMARNELSMMGAGTALAGTSGGGLISRMVMGTAEKPSRFGAWTDQQAQTLSQSKAGGWFGRNIWGKGYTTRISAAAAAAQAAEEAAAAGMLGDEDGAAMSIAAGRRSRYDYGYASQDPEVRERSRKFAEEKEKSNRRKRINRANLEKAERANALRFGERASGRMDDVITETTAVNADLASTIGALDAKEARKAKSIENLAKARQVALENRRQKFLEKRALDYTEQLKKNESVRSGLYDFSGVGSNAFGLTSRAEIRSRAGISRALSIGSRYKGFADRLTGTTDADEIKSLLVGTGLFREQGSGLALNTTSKSITKALSAKSFRNAEGVLEPTTALASTFAATLVGGKSGVDARTVKFTGEAAGKGISGAMAGLDKAAVSASKNLQTAIKDAGGIGGYVKVLVSSVKGGVDKTRLGITTALGTIGDIAAGSLGFPAKLALIVGSMAAILAVIAGAFIFFKSQADSKIAAAKKTADTVDAYESALKEARSGKPRTAEEVAAGRKASIDLAMAAPASAVEGYDINAKMVIVNGQAVKNNAESGVGGWDKWWASWAAPQQRFNPTTNTYEMSVDQDQINALDRLNKNVNNPKYEKMRSSAKAQMVDALAMLAKASPEDARALTQKLANKDYDYLPLGGKLITGTGALGAGARGGTFFTNLRDKGIDPKVIAQLEKAWTGVSLTGAAGSLAGDIRPAAGGKAASDAVFQAIRDAILNKGGAIDAVTTEAVGDSINAFEGLTKATEEATKGLENFKGATDTTYENTRSPNVMVLAQSAMRLQQIMANTQVRVGGNSVKALIEELTPGMESLRKRISDAQNVTYELPSANGSQDQKRRDAYRFSAQGLSVDSRRGDIVRLYEEELRQAGNEVETVSQQLAKASSDLIEAWKTNVAAAQQYSAISYQIGMFGGSRGGQVYTFDKFRNSMGSDQAMAAAQATRDEATNTRAELLRKARERLAAGGDTAGPEAQVYIDQAMEAEQKRIDAEQFMIDEEQKKKDREKAINDRKKAIADTWYGALSEYINFLKGTDKANSAQAYLLLQRMQGYAKTPQEKLAIEQQIFDARKQVYQERISNAEAWLSHESALDQIAMPDQIKVWEQVLAFAKKTKNQDAAWKAEEQIYSLKKQQAEQLQQNMAQELFKRAAGLQGPMAISIAEYRMAMGEGGSGSAKKNYKDSKTILNEFSAYMKTKVGGLTTDITGATDGLWKSMTTYADSVRAAYEAQNPMNEAMKNTATVASGVADQFNILGTMAGTATAESGKYLLTLATFIDMLPSLQKALTDTMEAVGLTPSPEQRNRDAFRNYGTQSVPLGAGSPQPGGAVSWLEKLLGVGTANAQGLGATPTNITLNLTSTGLTNTAGSGGGTSSGGGSTYNIVGVGGGLSGGGSGGGGGGGGGSGPSPTGSRVANEILSKLPPNTPKVVKTLLTKALSYAGGTYEWAGGHTNSVVSNYVDCSGLTYQTYKEAYPNLAPTQKNFPVGSAAEQLNWFKEKGQTVDPKDIKPGDFIYISSRGLEVGHTGVYVGGGMFENARGTGKGIGVDPVPWDRVTGVGRLQPNFEGSQPISAVKPRNGASSTSTGGGWTANTLKKYVGPMEVRGEDGAWSGVLASMPLIKEENRARIDNYYSSHRKIGTSPWNASKALLGAGASGRRVSGETMSRRGSTNWMGFPVIDYVLGASGVGSTMGLFWDAERNRRPVTRTSSRVVSGETVHKRYDEEIIAAQRASGHRIVSGETVDSRTKSLGKGWLGNTWNAIMRDTGFAPQYKREERTPSWLEGSLGVGTANASPVTKEFKKVAQKADKNYKQVISTWDAKDHIAAAKKNTQKEIKTWDATSLLQGAAAQMSAAISTWVMSAVGGGGDGGGGSSHSSSSSSRSSSSRSGGSGSYKYQNVKETYSSSTGTYTTTWGPATKKKKVSSITYRGNRVDHDGGIVGSSLYDDEFASILQKGEVVVPKNETPVLLSLMDKLNRWNPESMTGGPITVPIEFNLTLADGNTIQFKETLNLEQGNKVRIERRLT